MFLKLQLKLIEQIATEFRMRDRATPKEDRQFHLVAAIEEPRGLAAFGLKIGLANLGLDANFLELDYMLVAT